MSFYQGRKFLPQRFRLVLTSVLQTDGLPFADVLGEQEIQDAFDQHNVVFALEEDGVYTPSVTLWAFLSQVLHKNEQRSCLAAVSRVIVLLVALGRKPCAKNSGAFGFPIARLVVLVSLATAMVAGMEIGPYAGKATGELALMRELLGQLNDGDVLLTGRYFCSYFLIAMLLEMGVDFVTRRHQNCRTVCETTLLGQPRDRLSRASLARWRKLAVCAQLCTSRLYPHKHYARPTATPNPPRLALTPYQVTGSAIRVGP